MKISVILPFYNACKTLERALSSIYAQAFTDFECIMVDNNSTDNSRQIAADFQRRDNRFRVVSERRQGVVFAFNRGAALARGKYLCRMDADDQMFPLRLKLQWNFLQENMQYGAVCGCAQYEGDLLRSNGFRRYVDWVNGLHDSNEIRWRRFIESPVINPTAMWRKIVSDRYGLYRDGDFPEDYELWLRWLAGGVKIGKINQPLITWHDSVSRLTRTDPRYEKSSFYKIKSVYLAQWLAENNPDHPFVVVWGASRLSRSRAGILEDHKIKISAYIDISLKRKLDRNVVHYSEIPEKPKIFILVYVGHNQARCRIQKYLRQKGYEEGVNYLLVS